MSPFARSLLFLVLLLLAGCQSNPPADATPSPSPTNTPAPAPSATVMQTPSPGAILPTSPLTLTIWTTEAFAPTDEDAGGRHLLNQLLAFERGQSDLSLEVVVKRATGPGSIMDYLVTAGQVAPAVLPDILVLSTEMLARAAAAGHLQPLDAWLPPETIADLFPIADRLGRVGNPADAENTQLMGIPFMLDLEHLVYNTTVYTETGPATWEDVLESGGPYIFPAAAEAPVNGTLSHYLSAGGALYDEEGQPQLDVDPLTEVFRFYQQADQARVIPVAAAQTLSLAESWSAYRNGNALLAHVNAARYLADRESMLNTAAGPIPGQGKAAPAIVSGWHWAILTADPARQQLAADLLSWLMTGDNLGVWSFTDRWLPATSAALAVWPTGDPYVAFAGQQIQDGIPRPGVDFYELVQTRLAQAVRDVLLNQKTPAEAAANSIP